MAVSLTAGVELKTRKMGTAALTTGVATTIYAGSTLVGLAAGGVTNLPADLLPFCGFANETKVTTVGGTISAIVEGELFIPNANAALTDQDLLLYVDRSAADDDPRVLVVAPESAHDMSAGRIFRVEVGVGWWIRLGTISTVAP